MQYTLSCTYAGKPLTLTFDKKSWGTWNIGTWRYDGEALAGGGTDWEYVNMVGDSDGGLDWSGGNHGRETLVDIRFYDGSTGEELVLANGQSAEIRNLTIVEHTGAVYDRRVEAVRQCDAHIPCGGQYHYLRG